MMFTRSKVKVPTPTSTVRGQAGVWAQYQPQQCAPPKGCSAEAVLASRLSLHELWCAESTPEDVSLFSGDEAATPLSAHGACVGQFFNLFLPFMAPLRLGRFPNPQISLAVLRGAPPSFSG